MRSRWRRITGRRMARPIGGGPSGPGPKARVVLGWAAAVALVALIAFVVGRPSKDAGTTEPSPSGSATLPITFGTALDAGTGEATHPTDRFAAGDLFAYSVRLADPVGRDAVKVEVLRVDGDTLSVVQAPAAQPVSAHSRVIAFSVPADALVSAFGEGDFLMRIYRDSGQKPMAEGHFKLIAAG